MSYGKSGRPSWFKMFLHQKPLIDAVPDDVAGLALKAALHYFDTGKAVELEPLPSAVFAALKPHIDESFHDFQRSVDTGRAGSKKRWNKQLQSGDRPPIGPLPTPIGVPTEEDAEVEAEADGEEEGDTSFLVDKPPVPVHFSPPSVTDVRNYCKARGFTSIDPERFVNYYNSVNWMVGKNPMINWKSAVQSWYRNDLNKRRQSGGNESSIDRLARMYKEEFGE